MRAYAITPADYANLRLCPDTSKPRIGKVLNGQIVTVSTEVVDGWTRLVEPVGWVFPGVEFKRVPDINPVDVICDGFDAPVGTATERASAGLWPGWTNSNPFLAYTPPSGNASGSYHTGVDLNLNLPGQWNADAGKPLYAVASGVVIEAATFKTWGWLVIIRHDPLPDGLVVWSRYAHMATIDVIDGQRVARGEQIGTIGDAFGRWSHHLH
jgi:murein DD-endopeptidase MepM/ murein hydrolase activator NlpD